MSERRSVIAPSGHTRSVVPETGSHLRAKFAEDLLLAVRVSVVIPTLDEAANLPGVFEELPANLFDVIVVDGGSRDNTARVARSLSANVRVIQQRRPGKGQALLEGFLACRGDVIVALDGDGSMSPAEIPQFVARLVEGADFVKGSRFLHGAGSDDITWMRRMGNSSLRKLVNALYRTRYTDLCYGYFAFWAHCLPNVLPDCDGFEVETLMSIRAATTGLRIVEVPSFEANRLHGESKLHALPDGVRVMRTILRERLRGRPSAPPRPAQPVGHQPARDQAGLKQAGQS